MAQQAPNKRILFVDDEASIRATLPPVLERIGFEVRVAESVPDAIFEINSYQFDALITDLNIGEEGDGFLVASSMRHIQPDCAIFILTGYPAFETALQAIHTQVDDYLVKPVEIQTLVNVLKEKIEDRRPKEGPSFKRLAVVLKGNCAQIAEKTLEAKKADPQHAANGLPDERVRSYAMTFCTAIAVQMEQERDDLEAEALRQAFEYGRQRKQSRSAISVLTKDFRYFDAAVFQAIQNNLAELELVSLISDLKRFSIGTNLLMEQAFAGFATGNSGKTTHG